MPCFLSFVFIKLKRSAGRYASNLFFTNIIDETVLLARRPGARVQQHQYSKLSSLRQSRYKRMGSVNAPHSRLFKFCRCNSFLRGLPRGLIVRSQFSRLALRLRVGASHAYRVCQKGLPAFELRAVLAGRSGIAVLPRDQARPSQRRGIRKSFG